MSLPGWAMRSILPFVEAFARSDATAWIGVGSREGFLPVDRARPGLRLMRDFGAGGAIALMPGLPLDDGFIWLPAHGAAPPELWLAPTLPGYRAVF